MLGKEKHLYDKTPGTVNNLADRDIIWQGKGEQDGRAKRGQPQHGNSRSGNRNKAHLLWHAHNGGHLFTCASVPSAGAAASPT